MTALPTSTVFEQLQAGIDAVAALDPDAVSWAEQENAVRALELAARRLDGVRLRTLEAFARSGGWDDGAHLSAAGWVRDELGATRGDAGRDLALARALREWPAVAAALASGRVSTRAAGVLCSALTRLPEQDEDSIAMLVAAAQVCDPLTLARELAARVAAAAPDHARDTAEQVHHRRALHHATTLDDMGRLDAWLEPELAELFADALDAEAVRDRAADDDRTPAQRRHDAFGRLVRRAVGAPDAPRRHGAPVQLLVLASVDAVQGVPGAAAARTAGGRVLSQGALDRLSCASPLARCLLAGSLPLDLGRRVRTATEAQYRALVARDRGCAVRGCGRPASWCTPHHVIPWQHGGPTDLTNLVHSKAHPRAAASQDLSVASATARAARRSARQAGTGAEPRRLACGGVARRRRALDL
jgi:hypothetical protein